MTTIQGLRMRTEYMMQEIHRKAVEYTLEKFKLADRHYYETCEGGAEVTNLIHELERLGVDAEDIFDIDFEIREEVANA